MSENNQEKSTRYIAQPAPPSTPGYHADCIWCGEPSTDGITCDRHRPKPERDEE